MRSPPTLEHVRGIYDWAAWEEPPRPPRIRKRFVKVDAPLISACENAKSILEIGCGTGRLLSKLPSHSLGIDISVASVRVARNLGLQAIPANGHSLPFADESFDCIVSGNGSFRYLNYEYAFAECMRTLRPGGKLAVHQYSRNTWSPRQKNVSSDLHETDENALFESARSAGLLVKNSFKWRSIRYFPYALRLPAMAPSTLWSHLVLCLQKPGGTKKIDSKRTSNPEVTSC